MYTVGAERGDNATDMVAAALGGGIFAAIGSGVIRTVRTPREHIPVHDSGGARGVSDACIRIGSLCVCYIGRKIGGVWGATILGFAIAVHHSADMILSAMHRVLN